MESSDKKSIWCGLLIGFIIHTCWLIRILYLINLHPLRSESLIGYYKEFGQFDIIFIVHYFISIVEIFIPYILIILGLSLVIYLITKIKKLHVKYITHLKISIYAFSPYALAIFIRIFTTMNNLESYEKYIYYTSYLSTVILLIYGLKIAYGKHKK